MTLLVNSTNPYLRILLPDGDYAQFVGGQLTIDEDDTPFYDHILAEAVRNPSIAIMVSAATCRFCGADFTGKTAAKQLEEHQKEIHFDLWVKAQEVEAASVIQREIKARAGFVCDVCQPVQTFGSEDDLAVHVAALHTQPPELDDEGNTVGGDDGGGRRPGEVDPAPAPAARRSTTRRSNK